jgi:hypothetical protein
MTELDHITGNHELDLLPPQRAPQPHAVAVLTQHAAAMHTAYQLAEKLVQTDLVPARYRRKPDDATAAILYGAELGLNPIQSLQNVFAVNGAPAIYARTMAALLKSRGYRFRTPEKTSDVVEVHGWMPGRDPDTTTPDETSRWTIDDARRAGYTSNKKYETEPRAMLYAKALAEVCRHLAPDVLLGIAYSVDELQTEINRRPASQSLPITVDEIIGATNPDTLPDDTDKNPAEQGTPKRKPRKKPHQPRSITYPTQTDYEAATQTPLAPQDFSEPIHQPSDEEFPTLTTKPSAEAANRAVEVSDTKPRRAHMFGLLNKIGIKERDDYIAMCSYIIERPIQSSDELTQHEADKISSTIEGWLEDGTGAATSHAGYILDRLALEEAGQIDLLEADE